MGLCGVNKSSDVLRCLNVDMELIHRRGYDFTTVLDINVVSYEAKVARSSKMWSDGRDMEAMLDME